MKTGVLALVVFFVYGNALAVNYYVSASAGNNSNDGKSETKPFLTIQKAADLVAPGDTVFVMNGAYSSTTGPVLNLVRSGTAAGYITFKPLKGHKPILSASVSAWNAVVINGNYIVLDGLELMGNNANLTYDNALASYNEAKAGGTRWSYYAGFNTNGISMGGPRDETKFPHHLIVRNCTVHDFPGGGISAIQTDYVTIENNVVYNNGWYMMYGGSGISILTPFNSDQLTSYKNIVRNNRCFTNKTTIPWISEGKLSDGNGIIIDVNRYPYGQTSGEAYVGRTLVENNVSVNNGGSGVHAFKADHVDIINNTAYQNGTVVGYADIFANTCKDVNILNNIMYARIGGECNANNKNENVTYDYNLYFVGKVAVKGPHDLVADPQFDNPSTDRTTASFVLKRTSPAVDGGSSVAGQFSQKDILGVNRPQGSQPDMGAYEFTTAAVITATTEAVDDNITLFPNPAEQILTVRSQPLAGCQISIVNARGQVVAQQDLPVGTGQVSVSQLASGPYVLLLYRDGKRVASRKFVRH